MKIEIKKTSAEVYYDEIKQKEDISGRFSIGDIYTVFGIIFRAGHSYFYIFDQSHLVLINKYFVNVIDDKVPSNWRLKVWEDDESVTLWPALFYEENFPENFSDREEKERADFEVLRKEME